MPQIACKKTQRSPSLVILSAVSSLVFAGVGFGFWIGDRLNPSPTNLALRSNPGAQSADHSHPVQDLAAQIGEMQAELMRINALGERLARMSGLDPQEFDFGNPPPRGGPETGPTRDYTIKELADELARIADLVQDRERKLDRLADRIIEQRPSTLTAFPAGWPVRSGYISSTYGFRIHPVRHVRQFHSGVDFSSPRGSPIYAVADGIVVFSGWRNGYGKVVDIRHRNGLVTRYAHNSSNLVEEGAWVRQGQQIATVGTTGTTTGPHVHFEVIRNSQTLDPMLYLKGGQPVQRLASLDPDVRG
ncbi:peptidoglycan DD-metalloendopeptidase family protein [Caldichromatium japonicum]|uniref:Peptidoglycan DD-metalloendopeptidase family protein n=1 Tax=Caldichromatium japonicum TaxID=2699430 RepID=A0A6G7VEC5_9GAMM|nr:M23 family metallopeptidase [Caldichromatium japonicum]QIK38371.1 peptidoglycan DD-metalloendopeptidase family protein [Caldichromatium japonicum]